MTAVSARDITLSFGDIKALDGVTVEFEPGIIYGLLGPNGAGKTTLIRVLTTLLKPDTGSASVMGVDVVADPVGVRHKIGLAGQFAAVDAYQTGRENVEMVGRLYNLSTTEARRRAGEILERINLSEAADRQVKTYSGGMRRRLDLAASMVGQPEVLFLDEPTTGIDPASRVDLWNLIEDLVEGGTTLLLTTQYLDEADRLADRIGVIDYGKLIAEGTSDELKAMLGAMLSRPTSATRTATWPPNAWPGWRASHQRSRARRSRSTPPMGRGHSPRSSASSTLPGSSRKTSPSANQLSTTCFSR